MGPVVKDGKATEEEISQSPPLKRLQPDFRDEAEGYIGNRRYAFLGSKDYVSSSDDDDDNDDDDDDDDDDNDDDDDDDYYRYCSNDEEREYERELRCHIEKIISTNGYEFEYNPRLTTIGGFTTLDVDGEDVSGFLGWSYELAKFAIDQHNSKPEIMALVAKDKLAFDKLLIANVGASGMDFRLTFTAIKEKSGDRVTCQAALCPMFMKDPELWQLRLKPSDG